VALNECTKQRLNVTITHYSHPGFTCPFDFFASRITGWQLGVHVTLKSAKLAAQRKYHTHRRQLSVVTIREPLSRFISEYIHCVDSAAQGITDLFGSKLPHDIAKLTREQRRNWSIEHFTLTQFIALPAIEHNRLAHVLDIRHINDIYSTFIALDAIVIHEYWNASLLVLQRTFGWHWTIGLPDILEYKQRVKPPIIQDDELQQSHKLLALDRAVYAGAVYELRRRVNTYFNCTLESLNNHQYFGY